VETATLQETTGGIHVEDKGLKKNAITFVSNIVISVASVAPAYSLAATLGFIAAVPALGFQAPAVILVAFFPMAFIAAAYYYMNRADPDCGTTLLHRHRAVGADTAGAVGDGVLHAAGVRDRRAHQGLRQPSTAFGRAGGVVFQPIRHLQRRRAKWRHPASDLHLLGGGTRASASTNRPRTRAPRPVERR
jgi:hypothetical protein